MIKKNHRLFLLFVRMWGIANFLSWSRFFRIHFFVRNISNRWQFCTSIRKFLKSQNDSQKNQQRTKCKQKFCLHPFSRNLSMHKNIRYFIQKIISKVNWGLEGTSDIHGHSKTQRSIPFIVERYSTKNARTRNGSNVIKIVTFDPIRVLAFFVE